MEQGGDFWGWNRLDLRSDGWNWNFWSYFGRVIAREWWDFRALKMEKWCGFYRKTRVQSEPLVPLERLRGSSRGWGVELIISLTPLSNWFCRKSPKDIVPAHYQLKLHSTWTDIQAFGLCNSRRLDLINPGAWKGNLGACILRFWAIPGFQGVLW